MSREEWWLDFIEGEIDKTTQKEMEIILKNSKKDQELVKALTETKALIEDYAESAPKLSEDFFDDLHDSIMAKVEQSEMRAKPKVILRAAHKRAIKSISMSLALLVLSLGSGHYILTHKRLNTQWDVSQQIAQEAQDNPDDLSQMMSYQNEHDFLVDVASLSLDHLTKEQFETLLKTHQTR